MAAVRNFEITLGHNVILLHPVALCNFDLGIMVPSGATLFIETRPETEAVNRIAATTAILPNTHLRMAS
jgi:hypothetical protein